MEVRWEAEWLSRGHSMIQRYLWCSAYPVSLNLLENWNRLIAAHKNIIVVQIAAYCLSQRLPIPHRLHTAGAIIIPVPKKIGNATPDLHAREAVIEFRIVHQIP